MNGKKHGLWLVVIVVQKIVEFTTVECALITVNPEIGIRQSLRRAYQGDTIFITIGNYSGYESCELEITQQITLEGAGSNTRIFCGGATTHTKYRTYIPGCGHLSEFLFVGVSQMRFANVTAEGVVFRDFSIVVGSVSILDSENEIYGGGILVQVDAGCEC